MHTYSQHNYYRPTRQSLQRPQPPRRPLGIYLILGLLVVAGFIGASWGIPAAVEAQKRAHQAELEKTFSAQLDQTITPILKRHPSVRIGVGITDAQTGTVRAYGQKTAFPAASTSKIITALAYYHAVEQHQTDLSHKIGAYSARFQIQQMIQQSNNQSWHLLVEDLGRPQLQRYAQMIRSDYRTGENTLTAGSLSQTLVQLKNNQLLSKTYTSQLLSYMQKTNDEDLIPAALPADVTIHHKYGQLDNALHDASILTKNSESYSLVIYTEAEGDTSGKKRIPIVHELVRAIVPILFISREA